MKDENKFRHFSFSIKVNFGTLQNCFFIAYWLHDLKHYLIKNPNMYSGSFILSQFYSFVVNVCIVVSKRIAVFTQYLH